MMNYTAGAICSGLECGVFMAGLIIPAGMVLLVVGILLISILGAVFKQNSANIQKANKLYGICLLVIAGFVILYASIVS